MKKFRTKMDRLARAVMALMMAIALVAGGTGCFGTTTSSSNGRGAVAAVIAAAPIQPYVPLTSEEAALASSNGLLISPVGESRPVTVLDSQTTKDYVDAVRSGLQYVRVWRKINGELPMLPPLVAQMGRDLLASQGAQMQSILASQLVALGELSAARKAQLILAERYDVAETTCEGGTGKKGNLERAIAKLREQEMLVNNLRTQGSMVSSESMTTALGQLQVEKDRFEAAKKELADCRRQLQADASTLQEQRTRTFSAEQAVRQMQANYAAARASFNAQLSPYLAAVREVARPQ